jgi:ornithine cyclodeaminase
VVVEQRAAALEEAGDLVLAIAEGACTSDDIADLAGVVTGVAVRESPDDITVFKSVGLAMEDLAVAVAAVARLGA